MEDKTEEIKEQFYDDLQSMLELTKLHIQNVKYKSNSLVLKRLEFKVVRYEWAGG
jgi:hypothetical protein